MHLVLLFGVIGIAIGARLLILRHRPTLPDITHWRSTIVALTFPGMLLLSTAVAILVMGHHGQMWGLPVNSLPCLLAELGLGWILLQAAVLLLQQGQLRRWFGELPQIDHLDFPPEAIVHYLAVPQVIAGQMGLLQSRIVVSQGLLNLPSDQIRAILAHEQAHFHYRDPLWGLGLSWLCRVCHWMPGSDRLWQDLLLLRECRADAWAAQSVDPLLLAETLVVAVRSTVPHPAPLNPEWVGLQTASDRLAYRVQSLLQIGVSPAVQIPVFKTGLAVAGSLCLGLLPLGTIAFHHLGHLF
ncbi:MAG: M56 family metallopeptidase [Prochlorotrichaceae cyanobacterium]|jgi:Zn-dependent protease with chaperone function